MSHELIKVVLFEDLIDNTSACIQDVCEFLEVDFNKLSSEDFEMHANKTKLPKYLGLQLIRNRLMQGRRTYRYSNFLPIKPNFKQQIPWSYRLLDRLYNKINPKSTSNTYKPETATIALLNAYFKQELAEIDVLTKQSIFSRWFKF